MKKYFFIFLLNTLFCLCAEKVDKVNQDYYTEFKNKHKITKSQLVILNFIENLSCIGCLEPQSYSIDCIHDFIKQNKLENSVRIIGLVRVNRNIEIKSTLKKYSWTYEFESSAEDLKNKFGINQRALILLTNSNGEILFSFNVDERYSCCKKIITIIKENI